jgi:hypothetical protein
MPVGAPVQEIEDEPLLRKHVLEFFGPAISAAVPERKIRVKEPAVTFLRERMRMSGHLQIVDRNLKHYHRLPHEGLDRIDYGRHVLLHFRDSRVTGE